VFAAMDDVAGQAAEAEGEAAAEIEKGAGGRQDNADNEEEAAEVAGGVHEESLERTKKESKDGKNGKRRKKRSGVIGRELAELGRSSAAPVHVCSD